MIDLFVGGHIGKIQGEYDSLEGNRMYSAAWPPRKGIFDASRITAYIDSGAFTDQERLTPEEALARQILFEKRASEKWGLIWKSKGFVSYDRLIDEVWIGGQKHKRRWRIREADLAVRETVEAADYLSCQREYLIGRKLILSCQGVDAMQYLDCTKQILEIAQPDDIIGLGGWCILGRVRSWMPEFWRTIYAVLPIIAANGNKQIHIFGVLYLPALGGLMWLADQHGLSVSTDSSAPVRSGACTSPQARKKAGMRCLSGYWKDNVFWWINTLREIRKSKFYCAPPKTEIARQLSLW